MNILKSLKKSTPLYFWLSNAIIVLVFIIFPHIKGRSIYAKDNLVSEIIIGLLLLIYIFAFIGLFFSKRWSIETNKFTKVVMGIFFIYITQMLIVTLFYALFDFFPKD